MFMFVCILVTSPRCFSDVCHIRKLTFFVMRKLTCRRRFRGVAAGSVAACSRQSLVTHNISEWPLQQVRFAAPGLGAIVPPCWGSCAPLRCRCSSGAEGTERPVLTTRPRSTHQFCTLGHLAAASALHSGRQVPMSRSGRTYGCSVV